MSRDNYQNTTTIEEISSDEFQLFHKVIGLDNITELNVRNDIINEKNKNVLEAINKKKPDIKTCEKSTQTNDFSENDIISDEEEMYIKYFSNKKK